MSLPWYQKGLRFSCTRCGNCCTGAPGYVWLSDDELQALAQAVDLAEGEFQAVYTKIVGKRRSLREKPNGDCVFFDREHGCTVYEHRPAQCRTWPFWDSTTAAPHDWEATRRECPGAGKGELISAEEITRRVRVIPL